MRRWTLIVTCAAPDAVPFLLGLPAEELEQAKLIVTPHLAQALEEQRIPGEVHICAGVSTLDEARSVVGCARQPITIVIGPDPGNPLRCKGLIRARLLAPWALGPSSRADLVEVKRGGGVGRISRGLTRGALLRAIYIREGRQLVEYLPRRVIERPGLPLRAAIAIPLTMITLARVLPFIAWTEARARLTSSRA